MKWVIQRRSQRFLLAFAVILISCSFFYAWLALLELHNGCCLHNQANEWAARFISDERLVKLRRSKDTTRLQVILLWTSWFGDPTWGEFWSVGDQLLKVDGNACYLTTSRRYLPKASALVFHVRDLRFSEMPKIRLPWQRYVFYQLESPVNAHFNFAQWVAADMVGFNWTMSYRPTADIYAPYIFIENRSELDQRAQVEAISQRIQTFAKNYVTKKNIGFSLMSNCGTSSHRDSLVLMLKNLGVFIDVYGACSSQPEFRNPPDREEFFASYKFYFALENSFCADYATEKVTRAFQLSQKYGIIPVVYGGADYASLLPAGSYVDAQAFDNVEAFAETLIDLSTTKDTTRIEAYFNWQYRHFVDAGSLKTHLIRGMETLCRKLWLADLRPSSSNNHERTMIDGNNKDNNSSSKVHSTVTNLRAAFGECRV